MHNSHFIKAVIVLLSNVFDKHYDEFQLYNEIALNCVTFMSLTKITTATFLPQILFIEC